MLIRLALDAKQKQFVKRFMVKKKIKVKAFSR